MAFTRADVRTLDQHFRERNARPDYREPRDTISNSGEIGGSVIERRPWMRMQTFAEVERSPFVVRYHYHGDVRYSTRLLKAIPSMTYSHGAQDPQELVRFLRDSLVGASDGAVIDAIEERPVCSQCERDLADPPSTMCRTCRQDVAESGARE